jgi:hypothetical protein
MDPSRGHSVARREPEITRSSCAISGEQALSSTAIACIAFTCVFGSALIGVLLRSVLPEEHLSTDSKDVVKVSIALVATMAA